MVAVEKEERGTQIKDFRRLRMVAVDEIIDSGKAGGG